jgi:hypothetical protein
MIRLLAAAAALAVLALADAASAQTWGQPVYLNAYGRPVGGTPLSEVETRSYVATGRWAGGYSDRPQVLAPGPGYAAPYPAYHQGASYSQGHNRQHYGYDRSRQGQGHVHDRRARPGYRDVWGYNDDRPPSARGWTDDRRGPRYDRDCGCGDVYLYDR